MVDARHYIDAVAWVSLQDCCADRLVRMEGDNESLGEAAQTGFMIECAAGADVVGRLLDGVGEPARAHQRLAPIENSGPTAIKAQPAPRIGST
jgi:hypothetical protein